VPTYSYACTECGNRFDAVQAFTDDPLTSCPKCSGRVRKLFNSVGVVFKGSGFYRNDSRAESNGARKADKSKSDTSSEKSTSGSDSKSGSSTPAPAASAAAS
jgi:putative FmdB family regulatory protein